MTNRISAAPKRFETYEGQKWGEDVRREVNLLQDADVSMDTRMDTAESDIDSLETRMTTAESDVDTLEIGKVPYTGATGDVDIGVNKITVDRLALNASPSAGAVRELYWDPTYGLPSMMVDATNNVTMAIGAEVYLRGVNKTGAQINDGQVVYVSGAQGNRPKIALAKADTVGTSHVIGVATQNIAINAEGFVTLIGEVNGYNTSGFTEGDTLYLSASTAGALTNSVPSTPNNVVVVATALNSTSNGKISVHVHGGLAADTALGSSNRISPTQNAVKTYVDAKFGTAPNYTSFESDGTMVANGNATTFDDLSGSSLVLQQVGPGVSRNSSENTIEFVTTSNLLDYVYDNYQLRHAWKSGTTIYPHIHWEQAQNNIPNFLIRYRWQKNGGTKTTSWSDYKCNTTAFTYVSGTLNQICYGAGISAPVGYGISDVIEMRIFRDNANGSGVFSGADPYTTTVGITFIDIHIESDTLGSRTEYSK